MPDQPDEVVAGSDAASTVAWKRLARERPWYRKLASRPLAEATVSSPNGKVYLVRVRRNSPVKAERVDASDPPLHRVRVGRVAARAILVDVVLAVTNALERGDKLWLDDEE
ncbi:hypothetical protein [Jatrophihabitans sp. GAS493]|uniref:hypothetical protein n=1 Tax=Jatrophihabitans sp. GAS493 TaxID=1907575 RepID=UPI000BB6F3DD|nr:hypothetical protein [Jatrophihabitans sp. GAS493]